jgi:hypothetical protein
MKNDEPVVTGPWWTFGPLRMALVAGVIAASALLLELTGQLPEDLVGTGFVKGSKACFRNSKLESMS